MLDTDRRGFAKAAVLGAGVLASGPLLAQAGAPAQGQAAAPGAKPAPPDPNAPLAPPDKQPPELKLPEPKKKTGWAVVGLGKLAVEEILPAFGEASMARAVALVSGHPDKARRLAQVYGVKGDAIYDYGASYDRLRDNSEVEVVYIVLPNSMHAEYTVRALEAGKHVLCEKPMAVTPAECERMIAAARANNRQLMIAYRLHYEPFNQKMAELVRTGAIGKVKSISASNGQNTKAPNIRLSASLGGGPLGDTGIYCINGCRMVTNQEPTSVTAFFHQPADDPRFREVPESIVWTMRYPSGILAHCDTSFGTSEVRRMQVQGADGVIALDPAFSYGGQRLVVRRGTSGEGEVHADEVILKPVNHFAAEMDHFSECVQQGREPRTPGSMGLADMRIIDAIQRAMRSGRSERVG